MGLSCLLLTSTVLGNSVFAQANAVDPTTSTASVGSVPPSTASVESTMATTSTASVESAVSTTSTASVESTASTTSTASVESTVSTTSTASVESTASTTSTTSVESTSSTTNTTSVVSTQTTTGTTSVTSTTTPTASTASEETTSVPTPLSQNVAATANLSIQNGVKAIAPTPGGIVIHYRLVNAEGLYINAAKEPVADVTQAALVSHVQYAYNGSTVLQSSMQYEVTPQAVPNGFVVVNSTAQKIFLSANQIETVTFDVQAEAEENYYAVTYKESDATGAEVRSYILSSHSVTVQNFFSVPQGKQFAGWATVAGASTAEYLEQAPLLSGAPSGDITLYPVWEKGEYYVTYHTNYPEGSSMDPISKIQGPYSYGDNLITANTTDLAFAAPEGKVFLRWNPSPVEVSTAGYDADALIGTVGTNWVLYAIWGKRTVGEENYDWQVTATAYTGTYDGKAHDALKGEPTISALGGAALPTDLTYRYSLDNGKSWSTVIPEITDAGNHTILVESSSTTADKTKVTQVIATIEKASLTIHADDVQMNYQQSVPALTYTFTNEAGQNTFPSSMTSVQKQAEEEAVRQEMAGKTPLQTTATNTSLPNTYPITATQGVGQVTETKNYTLTYIAGNLTIKPLSIVDITIHADPYQSGYNAQEHPAATNVTSSLPNATFEYSLDGKTFSPNMPTVKDAGDYTLYIKATAPGYEGSKTITVKPNILPSTLVVDVLDYQKQEGQTDPTFEATVSGLHGDDTIVSLLQRQEGETPGIYEITAKVTSNGNYTIVVNPGILTITAVEVLPPTTTTPPPTTTQPEVTPTPGPETTDTTSSTPEPAIPPTTSVTTPPTTDEPETDEPETDVVGTTSEETEEEPEDTTSQPEAGVIPLPPITTEGTVTDEEPQNVQVNGQDLEETDYSIDEEGNFTLSPEFLQSLPDGEHVITLELAGDTYQSTVIMEGGVPLSAGAFQKVVGWSLFDLLMTIAAVLLPVLYLVIRPKKKSDEDEEEEVEEEEEDPATHKKRVITTVVLTVIAIAAVILLFVTQNFLNPMRLFDQYSILFAVFVFGQLILSMISKKKQSARDQSAYA